jgi:hypothetical protein
MKKIKKTEFDVVVGRGGGALKNPIIEKVKNLKPGEALRIPKQDWKMKTSPSIILSKYKKRAGIVTQCKTTKTHYYILRVE